MKPIPESNPLNLIPLLRLLTGIILHLFFQRSEVGQMSSKSPLSPRQRLIQPYPVHLKPSRHMYKVEVMVKIVKSLSNHFAILTKLIPPFVTGTEVEKVVTHEGGWNFEKDFTRSGFE